MCSDVVESMSTSTCRSERFDFVTSSHQTAKITRPTETQGIFARHSSRLLGGRCFPRGASKLDWHVSLYRRPLKYAVSFGMAFEEVLKSTITKDIKDCHAC